MFHINFNKLSPYLFNSLFLFLLFSLPPVDILSLYFNFLIIDLPLLPHLLFILFNLFIHKYQYILFHFCHLQYFVTLQFMFVLLVLSSPLLTPPPQPFFYPLITYFFHSPLLSSFLPSISFFFFHFYFFFSSPFGFEIFLDEQMEHKFYTIFLISHMT